MSIDVKKLNLVIQGYKEAIHFTEDEEDANNPNVQMMGITPESEFAEETLIIIESGCKLIFTACLTRFPEYDFTDKELARLGHDFWLTRNGHGSGFWDGDWTEEMGDYLTRFSRYLGQKEAYLGDDGLIYFL